jgi:hypothetical protein
MTPATVEYRPPGSAYTSEAIPYGNGQGVTIELHDQYFTLAWSTEVDAPAFMLEISRLLGPTHDLKAILQPPPPRGAPVYAFSDAMKRVLASPDGVSFIRVQAENEAFTWEASDPDASAPVHPDVPGELPGEVAIITSRLQPERLEGIIERTAIPKIVADLPGIMEVARRLTAQLVSQSA